MPLIHIEGRPYEVAAGQNLLQAALSLGFRLPYFCWHPALGSVGACRQCAVKLFKDEHDARGRIVMACMTPAAEGTRISIDDPEAVEFRAAVLEWLMTNHPHDCPVCDEGGECHLQDMTVMTGHVHRRHRFPKRTYRNQDLGPLIHHEMNRCIQCFRCVRFYHDYAGGRDLVPLGSRNQTYFGRSADGTLESPFSGNLVEVCPTGVFTDRRLRGHYTRKWDLQTAPSLCVHCGVGCNTIAGERYGELRRLLNRYHGEVNGYFLCDRGRYGYEFVNGPRRIRPGGSDEEAAVNRLESARARVAGRERIGIGSPRASLEANFALRELVGERNFYNGLGPGENAALAAMLRVLRRGGVRAASLREAESADAILLLGEDVIQTSPRLALALRQALVQGAARQVAADRLPTPAWDAGSVQIVGRDARRPFFAVAPCAVGLPDPPDAQLSAGADGIVRIADGIAREIAAGAPEAGRPTETEGEPAGEASFVRAAASALAAAKRPLLVCGASLGDPAPILAAARLARALAARQPETRIALVAPECNSLGVALLAEQGLVELQARLDRGGEPREAERPALIVLENDLERRIGTAGLDRLRASAGALLAIEHTETAVTRAADLVLPAATFAESSGTLVNQEGRAQHFYAVFPPAAGVRSAWRWAGDLAVALDGPSRAGAGSLARLRERLASAFPAWGARAMPPEASGVVGPVAQGEPARAIEGLGMKVPRQSHRATGRTAVTAHLAVSEPRPPEDPDSPLAHSMEGFPGRPPADLTARYWAPGWNSVQALTRFQEEIAGPLRGGDPGARLFDAPAPGDEPPDSLAHAAPAVSAAPAAAPHGSGAGERVGVASGAGDMIDVVPLAHLFGGEELSVHAPGILALAPEAYVALPPDLAARLGFAAGDRLRVATEGAGLTLPLLLRPDLPAGMAGLPLGLPLLAPLGAATRVRITRGEEPR